MKMKYHEIEEWELEEIKKTKKIIQDLFTQYKKKYKLPDPSSPKKSPSQSRVDSHIFSKLKQKERATELEKYLESPIIIPPTGVSFDLLEFWKHRETEYPVLSKIAKDFLASPATAVKVERVFSRAGLLLPGERQSMAPETISKVMCVDYWSRGIL
jgi:hAT family dimerisation domain.